MIVHKYAKNLKSGDKFMHKGNVYTISPNGVRPYVRIQVSGGGSLALDAEVYVDVLDDPPINAALLERAIKIWKSEDGARQFLALPNLALGGRIPRAVAATGVAGLREVLHLLFKIESGGPF